MMTFAHGAREVDAGVDRRDGQTDGQTDSQTDGHCTVIAKFHYTDPTGPARTQRSLAAEKSPCGSVWVRSGPCRVRVVEFSSYPTTCADFVGDPGPVGSVSVSV